MTAVYAKHEPYTNGHLGIVASEMDVAGAPTIRAVLYRDELFAIEGSHRLALAHARGVTPKVIVLEPEAGADLDPFFDSIKARLPRYDFSYVLALDVQKWTQEMGELTEVGSGHHGGRVAHGLEARDR